MDIYSSPAELFQPDPAMASLQPQFPPTLNLQHLEKFCHVVRYGGISAAVRHMPHGIQQPALSKAMAELECEMGARLTAVSVAIRAADLSVLEEGAATLTDGAWVYRATTARASGQAVTITATAVDRPGHTGAKTEPWTMA